jgi:hypothetical protein
MTVEFITDVTKAERVVERLSQSLKDLQARGEELSAERSAISFAALADGDAASQARLKKLNAEAATLNLEVENVSSALAEAGKRLRVAQEAEALEAKREQAHELRKVNTHFAQLAIDMDEALQKVRDTGIAMQATLHRMHELGSNNFPSHAQLQTLGTAAVKAALMTGPFKIEHLAPSERRTFGDLALGWYSNIERNISALIGPPADEGKEEAA